MILICHRTCQARLFISFFLFQELQKKKFVAFSWAHTVLSTHLIYDLHSKQCGCGLTMMKLITIFVQSVCIILFTVHSMFTTTLNRKLFVFALFRPAPPPYVLVDIFVWQYKTIHLLIGADLVKRNFAFCIHSNIRISARTCGFVFLFKKHNMRI